MKLKTNKFLLLAICSIALAGCSKDEKEGDNNNVNPNYPKNFSYHSTTTTGLRVWIGSTEASQGQYAPEEVFGTDPAGYEEFKMSIISATRLIITDDTEVDTVDYNMSGDTIRIFNRIPIALLKNNELLVPNGLLFTSNGFVQSGLSEPFRIFELNDGLDMLGYNHLGDMQMSDTIALANSVVHLR